MRGACNDVWRKHGVEPAEAELLSSSAGWLDPRYLPLERGVTTCVTSAVDLGRVTVTREAWQQHPVHVTVGVPDGRMGIFLQGDEATECDGWGRPFGPTQLGVATDNVEATLAAGSQILAAVLSKEQLEKTARALGLDLDPALLRSSGLTTLSAAAAEVLRRALAESLDVENARIVAEETESRLLATFCEVLSGPDPVRLGASQRLVLARAARDYIEANLTQPLRLEELALAVDADIRRLQRAFHSVFGMSPYRYLLCRRLLLARRRLRSKGWKSSTVTQIAGESGFGHLGRFSVDYRAMFGESPSVTLSTSRA
jgi:AraC-like DNA-binding protein